MVSGRERGGGDILFVADICQAGVGHDHFCQN
jgi:hypothetical protein